jgi:hypothetical protein
LLPTTQAHAPPDVRVARPRGSSLYLWTLLALPSMLLLSLPLLLLMGLAASPAIVFAGTLQFLREALRGARGEGRRYSAYAGRVKGRAGKDARRAFHPPRGSSASM